MDRQEAAEATALRVFAWLIGEDDVRDGFLGASGVSVADLPALAGQPEFLGAVLDHVLQSDDWVIAAAASAGVRPEGVAQARAALPGGQVPDWT